MRRELVQPWGCRQRGPLLPLALALALAVRLQLGHLSLQSGDSTRRVFQTLMQQTELTPQSCILHSELRDIVREACTLHL